MGTHIATPHAAIAVGIATVACSGSQTGRERLPPIRVVSASAAAPTGIPGMSTGTWARRVVAASWRGRGRKKRTGIGWRQVTLGKDGRPWGPRRTLIVVWGRRTDPWTLLVHGVLRSSAEVERYVRAFESRWRIEEAIRHGKDKRQWGFNLNDVRVRKYHALCALLVLVRVAALLMAGLRLRLPRIAKALAACSRAVNGNPIDPSYRIHDGLGTVLGRTPRWRLRRWVVG